ncbi:unnamed protein product [Somion occarium]|uniref:Fe2OG dioxygenase domain-containing protein n=1 Tax=Somion occarium TaxID=3059160 RepID=A0ABP1D703_9APHY
MPSAVELQDPGSTAYKKAKRKHLKTIRNRPEHVDADWTPFRAAEKKYKARFPPPDLSAVFDLAASDPTRVEEIKCGGWKGRADAVDHREIDLGEGTSKKAYIFPSVPGLVLLPSFVSPQEQRRLVQWSLKDHARHPNETNLDTHYILPHDGLWNSFLRSRNEGSPEEQIQPRASVLDSSPQLIQDSGPRPLISNVPVSKSNFIPLITTPKLPAPPSLTVKPTLVSALIPKLRWANIGWYYHWGTKQYDFSRGKIDVDPVISNVCKKTVSTVPWAEVHGNTQNADGWSDDEHWSTWNDSYEPDAGIVNFYQTKDTLMAHVDRSEVCATSPLVSISLGCAAVFLMGGLTRDVEPIPILLRSGDVVIMSGPQCRRAYHGVPRILEDTLPALFGSTRIQEDKDWPLYEEYMRTTRININVRQVFPKGFKPELDLPGLHDTNRS